MDDAPSGKRAQDLTPEDFDRLLNWLDPDREQAGEKYEQIRRQLIKVFVCRGCTVPEELADKTINRVVSKLPEIADTYVGNPALFFCGVARLIHLEHLRRKPDSKPPPPLDPPEDSEHDYECLDRCMQGLTAENRGLILEYYSEEKQAKIDKRQELAARLGIAPAALRLRATRIRAGLQECMVECVRGN